jgi:hypothetical protein
MCKDGEIEIRDFEIKMLNKKLEFEKKLVKELLNVLKTADEENRKLKAKLKSLEDT